MRRSTGIAAFGLLAASVMLSGTGMAGAIIIFVDDNITAPLPAWTADNDYELTGNRFVKPGSILRIEPCLDGPGTLVVARAHEGTRGGVIVLGRGYVANNTVAGPNPAREVRMERPEDRGFCAVTDLRCLDDSGCTGGLRGSTSRPR